MIEAGLYHRGVDYLQAYLEQRPDSSDGWYWLAKGLQGMGKLQESQRAFTKVLEIDPEFPQLSRVLQNREKGEAIPLWDRSRKAYRQALPVIAPGRDIYRDHVEARPTPIPHPTSSDPGPNDNLINTQKETIQTVPGFSAMGARKIVLPPQGTSDRTPVKVVPIPPVKELTGEPEGPGIPTVKIVEIPLQDSSKDKEPVYVPPKPHLDTSEAP
ncbi:MULTISPECIES: tetratricopeptide repeat protein [Dethiosulfovibrio]|uniref:Tetratricopeptide repeat protein n=2 Tax=Dethiosulfovibrio TaxID=47054 RepID=A0ABS9EJ18_9BACT|nr:MULTISPECIES: tetratricopeptide repeat protein [Dethiosulfovibrio]MCF4112741.1 tetratricopeptide repeat protein [Dethiosulfovibrio russensis]MCF4141205.1 tetratricopeptide repeat protein [Dethiosulfovibrio marinus]MCF4144891.1 tetratricopeptide repeat protein [Dethiosulfovibrio acidaminovorans]